MHTTQTPQEGADLTTHALQAIIANCRSLADQLEGLIATAPSAVAEPKSLSRQPALTPGAIFDPERDAPPVTPAVHGTREAQDWCVIVFFGRLRALNIREGRGATVAEQRAIGNAAGYKGRSGYNGWSWTWEDREDGRWITEDTDLSEEDTAKGRISGMGFLREYLERRNVQLPKELR